jgi:glycerol-3-phosphate acyltransferase PlsY
VVGTLIVGAYLIGGIPFGLLVGLLRGVDVRTAGSRNIGATNVGRLVGRPFGVAVFVMDVLKGLIPTFVAGAILTGRSGDVGLAGAALDLCWLAVGAACVLGHNYPVYLAFHGGKGVATSLGVALGIYPDLTYPALLAFGIWIVVAAATRYVSLASMSAGVAFPIAFVVTATFRGRRVTGEHWPLLVFTLLLAILVLVRHRSNMKRLLAGTEAKIGQAKPRPASDPVAESRHSSGDAESR